MHDLACKLVDYLGPLNRLHFVIFEQAKKLFFCQIGVGFRADSLFVLYPTLHNAIFLHQGIEKPVVKDQKSVVLLEKNVIYKVGLLGSLLNVLLTYGVEGNKVIRSREQAEK